MKPITLTMLQAVRLAIMLDNHQGNRKDLRILRDVRTRLGISDEKLASLVTPVPNGLSIAQDVVNMDGIEVQFAPEEARRLIEIIDGQTFVVRDLAWVEPLARDLQAITQ